MMVNQFRIALSAFILSVTAGAAAGQAIDADVKPLSFKACGEKYRAAKVEGALGDQKWLDFRSRQCGIRISQRQQAMAAPRAESTSAEALRRVAFPGEVAVEFADLRPAQQRMRTCLKAYHSNKQAGALAGLRWVQKGGGYYSLCTARLKAPKA